MSVRRALIAVMQTMVDRQMLTGAGGNASSRADTHSFWITPSGRSYADMKPEELILLDEEQNILAGTLPPSTETPLHAAMYRIRPEVQAIVHVHSLYAGIFAVAHREIPVVWEEAAQILGQSVPTAAYAPCGSTALVQEVLRFGIGKRALLLANHGLIAFGADLEDAADICYAVERAACVAVGAQILGGIHTVPAGQAMALHQAYMQSREKKSRE
jgi:L-fuculose-phosphate aldolase